MDEAALIAAVEARTPSMLADLGRPAVLVALCDGEPIPEAICRAAWAGERAAAGTFAHWADSSPTAAARATFDAMADQERAHAERVSALFDEVPAPVASTPGPLHGYLRGLESPAARAGAGLIGRPLASLRTYDRIRRYAESVDEAALAACIGELRADTRETVTAGHEVLEALGGGDPPASAIDAAVYAVRLIHDDYADTLAQLGRSFAESA